MNDLDLADLRQKAEAATPGPWLAGAFMVVIDDWGDPIATVEDSLANTDYIAAANPATILRLLDLLTRVQQAGDRYKRREFDSYHELMSVVDQVRTALTERSATR